MSLIGRWCRCDPLMERDLQYAFALMVDPSVNARMRFRGQVPSFAEFAAHAWDEVLCQWIVRDTSDRHSGIVVLSNPDFVDGYAWLSAARDPRSSGLAGSINFVEAVCLVLHYAWATWPLRMISFESPASSYTRFSSGEGRFFAVEGRLQRRKFLNGSFEDVLIVTMTRDQWTSHGVVFMRRLQRRRSPQLTRMGGADVWPDGGR